MAKRSVGARTQAIGLPDAYGGPSLFRRFDGRGLAQHSSRNRGGIVRILAVRPGSATSALPP
jgi:hypothetical protein